MNIAWRATGERRRGLRLCSAYGLRQP